MGLAQLLREATEKDHFSCFKQKALRFSTGLEFQVNRILFLIEINNKEKILSCQAYFQTHTQ
jgi:hypothetical protein